jgi:hypothetical protein
LKLTTKSNHNRPNLEGALVLDQEFPCWEGTENMLYTLTVKTSASTTEEKVGKHFAESG